jgi:hypothetical protein
MITKQNRGMHGILVKDEANVKDEARMARSEERGSHSPVLGVVPARFASGGALGKAGQHTESPLVAPHDSLMHHG